MAAPPTEQEEGKTRIGSWSYNRDPSKCARFGHDLEASRWGGGCFTPEDLHTWEPHKQQEWREGALKKISELQEKMANARRCAWCEKPGVSFQCRNCEAYYCTEDCACKHRVGTKPAANKQIN